MPRARICTPCLHSPGPAWNASPGWTPPEPASGQPEPVPDGRQPASIPGPLPASSAFLQVALQDSRALPRLKLLVRIFTLAQGKEVLVSIQRGLILLQLVQDNGAEKPVAGCVLAQVAGAVERRQGLRIGPGQVK